MELWSRQRPANSKINLFQSGAFSRQLLDNVLCILLNTHKVLICLNFNLFCYNSADSIDAQPSLVKSITRGEIVKDAGPGVKAQEEFEDAGIFHNRRRDGTQQLSYGLACSSVQGHY